MMLIKLMGIPEDVSADGYLVDHMLEFCHWFMLLLFVGWSCFFVYLLWRFRKSNNPVAQYHGFRSKATTHVEISVVLVEAVLLIGFALPLWAKAAGKIPTDGALPVHVTAYQFGWLFHYAGEDGKFGRRDPSLVTGSNPLGIDWSDPDSKDDVVSMNTMHVPIGQKVVVRLTSKDVIHNFACMSLRVSRDAIPGLANPLWFTAVKEGEYDIMCGQLCGAGHSLMKGVLSVEPVDQFNTYIKTNKAAPAEQKTAAVP